MNALVSRLPLVLTLAACAGSGPSAAAEPVAAQKGPAGAIQVVATGFRNDDGQALIAVYDSAEGFPSDADAARVRRAVPIAKGRVRVRFPDLPPGDYAVAVLHDENENFTMDTGLFGIPKEGYGVSNNAKGRFGPPKWGDAVFELAPGQTVTQTIALIYH